MKQKGKTKNSLSPFGELLKYSMIGSAISIICLVIFSLIAAFVISKSDLPHRSITPISLAIIGISVFIGSLIAGKMLHKKGLALGIVVAVITLAIMLIAGFFIPNENALSLIPIKILVSVIPSLIGAVIGVNMRKKY